MVEGIGGKGGVVLIEGIGEKLVGFFRGFICYCYYNRFFGYKDFWGFLRKRYIVDLFI